MVRTLWQADNKSGNRVGNAPASLCKNMKEAFFLLIGAAISCLFAVWQRRYEAWKSFQEEIALIRDRFDQIEDTNTGEVVQVYGESMSDVATAIHRVRPYLFRIQQSRLVKLLRDYRTASHNKESGLDARPIPPDYHDSFSDPEKTRLYLVNLLDQMVVKNGVFEWLE